MRTQKSLFAILVALSVVAAWLVGALRERAESSEYLGHVLPEADRFAKADTGVYVGYAGDGDTSAQVGYVATGSALGYSGPIETAVGLTNEGQIVRIAILRETETFAFFRKILEGRFSEAVIGKHCADPFQVGRDIQAITGATISLEGLTESIRLACRNAAHQAQIPVAAGPSPRITIGFPEIALFSLYVIGFLAYGPGRKFRRALQWVGLGLGLALLGFWLNRPMSLVHINALLLGYWPVWQTHVYWYLLAGGVLLPIVLTGHSVYCTHVCPFGAAQQAVTALGGGRRKVPEKMRLALRWGQRLLVWLAVICALAARNPAIVQYEVSGTLFGLTGAIWQFALLAVILVASLAVTRPWCNALCPVRAITDYIRLVRRCFRGVKSPEYPQEMAALGSKKA